MKVIIEEINHLFVLFKHHNYNNEDVIEAVQYFLEKLESIYGEQLLHQIIFVLKERFKWGSF